MSFERDLHRLIDMKKQRAVKSITMHKDFYRHIFVIGKQTKKQLLNYIFQKFDINTTKYTNKKHTLNISPFSTFLRLFPAWFYIYMLWMNDSNNTIGNCENKPIPFWRKEEKFPRRLSVNSETLTQITINGNFWH